VKREIWFDGDFSECYYGTGDWTKDEFAAAVNADEFMESEEPCRPEDVEDTFAKPLDDERFELQKVPEYQPGEPDPYPILVWRPM
jgi:hypothetical protein